MENDTGRFILGVKKKNVCFCVVYVIFVIHVSYDF